MKSTTMLFLGALAALAVCSCDDIVPDDGPPDEYCTPCNGEPLPGCAESCSKTGGGTAKADESESATEDEDADP